VEDREKYILDPVLVLDPNAGLFHNRWKSPLPDHVVLWHDEHNDMDTDDVIRHIFKKNHNDYVNFCHKYYVEMEGNTWFNAIPWRCLASVVEKHPDCVGRNMTLGTLRQILKDDVGNDPDDWNSFWF